MDASVSPPAPASEDEGTKWPAGPAKPALTRAAVHVWRADLAPLGASMLEPLSAAERKRYEQIVRADQRASWGRSRGLLRVLLGRYLTIPPAEVELSFGASGKPRLAAGANSALRSELCFNLSHSGQIAMYAFALGEPVGVDVQLARPSEASFARDHLALARRALGEPAAATLARLPEAAREGEFLRLWTRHEATLKCLGLGLGGNPRSDEVRGGEEPPDERSPWLADLDVGPRAAAAVACARAPRERCCWSWA